MRRGNNYSGARWAFSRRPRQAPEPRPESERPVWRDKQGRTADEIVSDLAAHPDGAEQAGEQ